MEPSAVEPACRAGSLQTEEPDAFAHERRRDAATIVQTVDTYASSGFIAQNEIHAAGAEHIKNRPPHVVRQPFGSGRVLLPPARCVRAVSGTDTPNWTTAAAPSGAYQPLSGGGPGGRHRVGEQSECASRIAARVRVERDLSLLVIIDDEPDFRGGQRSRSSKPYARNCRAISSLRGSLRVPRLGATPGCGVWTTS
jgi:hypothetical protein